MSNRDGAEKIKHFSEAKRAIKRRIGRYQGQLKIQEDPEIAIEVLDDDIEGNRPIEQALVAEHLFRKTIEESIGVGIAGFDLSWKQIYVNRTFCQMVGWSESELMNHPHPQPYLAGAGGAAAPNDLIPSIQRVATSPGGFEFQFRRKSGSSFWALVHANMLSDTNGNIVGRLISIADIDIQKKNEATLRLLSTRLIDAQEHERKLLCQDLHDSIGGCLAGIKYGLEKITAKTGLREKGLKKMLADTIRVVRTAIEETQRITKNLHPAILDDLGLLCAIREHCREIERIYPHIEVELDLRIDEAALPDTLKILTYRVLQEAFNNIAKHSSARRAKVRLRQFSDCLEMKIADDGQGFDPSIASGKTLSTEGLGLGGMRERAELFGGSFGLETGAGQGTRIRVVWPI